MDIMITVSKKDIWYLGRGLSLLIGKHKHSKLQTKYAKKLLTMLKEKLSGVTNE